MSNDMIVPYLRRVLNETSTTTISDDTGGNDGDYVTAIEVMYYLLAAGVILMCCFCSRSRVPDDRFLREAAERRSRWLHGEERKDRMRDPEYRMRLILRGLVMKRIVDQRDGGTTLLLGSLHDSPTDGRSLASLSIDSMDEETSVCAICLGALRPGDIVGLSRTLFDRKEINPCNHAFHRDCIVSWLMRPTNDACPSCRNVIVQEIEETPEPLDSMEKGRKENLSNISDDEEEATEGYASSVLVIVRGLVSRVKRAGLSMIGQHINVKRGSDLELTPPETPPSPFRRVYSLEGSALRERSVNLRRQRSSGSLGKDTSGPASGIMLPLVLEEPVAQLQPLRFRRVVSDFTGAQSRPVVSSVGSSPSRRPALPFRPRSIHSGHLAAPEHLRRTDALGLPHFDCSERSVCSEDEIIVTALPPDA